MLSVNQPAKCYSSPQWTVSYPADRVAAGAAALFSVRIIATYAKCFKVTYADETEKRALAPLRTRQAYTKLT